MLLTHVGVPCLCARTPHGCTPANHRQVIVEFCNQGWTPWDPMVCHTIQQLGPLSHTASSQEACNCGMQHLEVLQTPIVVWYTWCGMVWRLDAADHVKYGDGQWPKLCASWQQMAELVVVGVACPAPLPCHVLAWKVGAAGRTLNLYWAFSRLEGACCAVLCCAVLCGVICQLTASAQSSEC